MLLRLLQAREAVEVGVALADDVLVQTGRSGCIDAKGNNSALRRVELRRFLDKFLTSVDRRAQPLRLNIFKRAKLANAFKWKLLERGVEPDIVDELTQALVLRLGGSRGSSLSDEPRPAPSTSDRSGRLQGLMAKGEACLARGESAEAVRCYRELLSLDPRNVAAGNNLGAALYQLGRYEEAEEQFRRSMSIKPGRAHDRSKLQTALKVNLSSTLVLQGRLREAKTLLEKVLRTSPRHVDALVGMGEIAGFSGRFAEAEALFRRAAELDPKAPRPWAALVRQRRMTSADAAWLERAEEIAARGLSPLEEATLRYAIGKYHDDVGDFERAFHSYRLANELQRKVAEPYDRKARTRFVEDMTRVYSREVLARTPAGASDSVRPVFVVGMPRSGTTLVAQIIHSHPAAKSAGELGFWSAAMRRHEPIVRHEPVGEPLVAELAAEYLRLLAQHSPDALRVIDKATFNSEYLGVIHRVFPRARFIYLRRDPIDTCLSCYSLQLSQQMSFSMDLSDLAHYYRAHQRLVAHWRSVLPAGTLLDVPYAGLVADQEHWARRILEFLRLEWDPRCLDFHRTERTVMTASYWQVRQELYTTSVGRWRNYQKFIGPLLDLRDPGLEPTC
jgi:tetratricopeptide (TPR) repeat protein